MKDRQSFVAGLLTGLAPPSVFEGIQYPRLEGSDMARMRGDVERVGKQFSHVIDREHGETFESASGRVSAK
jgi:hypothetical protein